MKSVILSCIVAGAYAWSCQDVESTTGCGEKWQLVEMTGSMANFPPTRGDDMEWQEWYVLYPDSTFTKTRERDNSIVQKRGTWAVSVQSGQKDLILTYEENTALIASCFGGNEEVLRFTGGGSQLVGTWILCDGPGLTYERVPYDCAIECAASPR